MTVHEIVARMRQQSKTWLTAGNPVGFSIMLDHFAEELEKTAGTSPALLPRGEYVLKSVSGQYLDFAGQRTWAPAFAMHFATEFEAETMRANVRMEPQDEAWKIVHAPHI